MKLFEFDKCPVKPMIKILILTVAWWTIVMIGSYELTRNNNQKAIQALAISEARSHFEKDVLFRKWGAERATGYMIQNEKTSPNPYLSHLADRDIVTADGKKPTIVNPAMLHETNSLSFKSNDAKGHMTSLRPLNPKNKADEWETKALKSFEQGVREVASIEYIDGVKYVRFMGPLFVEESCLKCHAQSGYKIGDVRGGVGILLPYSKYDDNLNKELFTIMLGHIFVWFVGVVGILLAQLFLARADCKQRMILVETEKLSFRNMLLSALSEGVYGISNGKLLFINQAALNILGYTEDEVIGKCPHAQFHYKYPNGEPYPLKDCPSEKSTRDGLAHSGEDMLFKKDGSGVPVEIHSIPLVENNTVIGAVVAFRDISTRLKMQEELKKLARTDFLTELNNRRTFKENMELDFKIFKRNSQNCAVLMIDIDHFKAINDEFGHAAGDVVLKELAQIMADEVRSIDYVGRLGGEEFGVVLRQTGIGGAVDFGERLQKRISQRPVTFEDNTIIYTVSIGITTFMQDDKDDEVTLSRADKALYSAKESGRNQIKVLI